MTAGNRNAAMADPRGGGSAGRLGLPGDVLAGGLIDRLHAELDLAAIVHADDLDLDEIADLDDIGDGLDPLGRQLADVNEAVATAEEVHEGAEIDDLHDLAAVDDADLRLRDDAADPVDRGLRGLGVDGRHLDRAVVLDVDLGTGHLADLANDLATRADDLADLVLGNVDHGDPRRVLADRIARLRHRLGHFAEDVEATLLRLRQRDLHDLRRDRGDLDVHLQRRHALRCTGDLEVHVAEVIFVAEDVGQHGKTLVLLDETHGDAGDRA